MGRWFPVHSDDIRVWFESVLTGEGDLYKNEVRRRRREIAVLTLDLTPLSHPIPPPVPKVRVEMGIYPSR